MTIDTKELVIRTGATIRQLDFWCSRNVISPLGATHPGSGYIREFDELIVDRVRLLVIVSNAFGNRLSVKTLKKIYEHFDEGFVEIAAGIVLRWMETTEGDEK